MTLDQETLDSRIIEAEPGIFVLRELQDGTVDTWRALSARLLEVVGDRPSWGLIIDLSDVKARPKGEYREAITRALKAMSAVHFCMVQPGNILLRSVLRFIVSNINERTSVHKDVDSALETMRGKLAIAVGG